VVLYPRGTAAKGCRAWRASLPDIKGRPEGGLCVVATSACAVPSVCGLSYRALCKAIAPAQSIHAIKPPKTM